MHYGLLLLHVDGFHWPTAHRSYTYICITHIHVQINKMSASERGGGACVCVFCMCLCPRAKDTRKDRCVQRRTGVWECVCVFESVYACVHKCVCVRMTDECVCVCVCVCKREIEREKERETRTNTQEGVGPLRG